MLNTLIFLFGNLFCYVLPGAKWAFLLCGCLSMLMTIKGLRLAVICFVLGIGWQFLHIQRYQSHILPHHLEGKTLLVVGRIISPARINHSHQVFLFQTTQFNGEDANLMLRLSWYQSNQKVQVGEQWQFVVRLKQPHSEHNPGGINGDLKTMRQAISAIGYVYKDHRNKRLKTMDRLGMLSHWRQSHIDWLIKQNFFHFSVWPLLVALSFGDARGMSIEQRQIFQHTGTAHLMSISGLHVGLVASLFYFFFQTFWRYIPVVTRWLPAPTVGALAGLIAATCYSLVSGFGIATQRALIMLLMMFLPKFIYRHVTIKIALRSALLLILTFEPFAVISPGFWLSFVAVWWLSQLSVKKTHQQNRWCEWGKSQWFCFIGLLPLSVYFFHQLSIVSLIANMLAIPWVGMVSVPFCLLGLITISVNQHVSLFCWQMAAVSLQSLWPFLVGLAHLPFAYFTLPMYPMVRVIILILSVVLLLIPRHKMLRISAVLMIILVLIWHPPVPKQKHLWLTVLDVGQGLASIIRTQHHTLVFDTGVGFGRQFNMGDRVILPYLQAMGVKNVDTVVISHPDLDHRGGLNAVMQQWPYAILLTSFPRELFPLPAQRCIAGQHWSWDGVSFDMLASMTNTSHGLRKNNLSCVLRVSGEGGSVLLTGDIEKQTEHQLVQRYGYQLMSTVLVVPHHGSRTSSSVEFLRAINPKTAVFSYGYRNPYHHPHPKVLGRYRQLNIHCRNTLDSGAVELKL